MVLDKTKSDIAYESLARSGNYIEGLSLTLLGSTLDGVMLTHLYVITTSACNLPAGRPMRGAQCNAHSCSSYTLVHACIADSGFMTVHILQLGNCAEGFAR